MDKKPLSRTAKYYKKVRTSKRHSSSIDIFELICKYRDHDCLWNFNSEHYKDRLLKAKAWNQLAREFNTDISTVKTKMKNLRSAYVLEKRKVDKSKLAGEYPPYKPGLSYYDYLNFLDNIVVWRKTQDFGIRYDLDKTNGFDTSCDMEFENVETTQNCDEQNYVKYMLHGDVEGFTTNTSKGTPIKGGGIINKCELIAKYKENSCLWNHNSSEYKDRKLKQACWESIATYFNQSVSVIKSQIKNMRRAYFLEKKIVTNSKLSDELLLYTPNLFYYSSFSFLDDFETDHEVTDKAHDLKLSTDFDKISPTKIVNSEICSDSEEAEEQKCNSFTKMEYIEPITTLEEDEHGATTLVTSPALISHSHNMSCNQNIDVYELISKYRDCECLWNIHNEDYKNTFAKQKAWESIAEYFGKEVVAVKTKVNNLRSVYVTEKKKVEKSKTSGGPLHIPNLSYYNHLAFLDTVVLYRKCANEGLSPIQVPPAGPNSIDTFELISQYKLHECLWNISNKNYKNTYLKQYAWEAIAEHFGKDAHTVKMKIKNLRSAYVVEKKKVDKSKTSGRPVHSPCLFYYKQLSFLDSCVLYRKETDELELHRTNNTDKLSDFEATNDLEFGNDDAIDNNNVTINNLETIIKTEMDEEEIEQPSNQLLAEPSTSSEQIIPKIVLTTSLNPESAQMQSQGKSKLLRNLKDLEQHDVYTSFGRTIALQLKQLPLDEASITMLDIHKILTKKILAYLNSTNNVS